jgi:hypothetical protein
VEEVGERCELAPSPDKRVAVTGKFVRSSVFSGGNDPSPIW